MPNNAKSAAIAASTQVCGSQVPNADPKSTAAALSRPKAATAPNNTGRDLPCLAANTMQTNWLLSPTSARAIKVRVAPADCHHIRSTSLCLFDCHYCVHIGEKTLVWKVAKVALGSCVDGSLLARVILIFVQIGRVLSCVRPVDAAHMAAGPNAIRRIGSQSKARALCALTQTGFPNPRFDRFCITSLSLCQTV